MARHIADTGSPMPKGARRSTRIRTQAVRKFASPNDLNTTNTCKTRARTRQLNAAIQASTEESHNGTLSESDAEETDEIVYKVQTRGGRKRKIGQITHNDDVPGSSGGGSDDQDIHEESGDASGEDSDSFKDRRPKKRKLGMSNLLSRRRRGKMVQPLVLAGADSSETGEGQEVIPNWLVPAMRSYWPIVLREASINSSGGLSGSWLVSTATVCREFAASAMIVLYDSPAIQSERKLKKLVATLKLPPEMTKFHYRANIHSLHLGPDFIPGNAQITKLVELLPRLEHMSINTSLDEPPYRELGARHRRNYPNMWEALAVRNQNRPDDMVETFLRSWKWSWGLLGSDEELDHIISLQSSGPLRGLRSLRMVSFLGNPDDLSKRRRPKKKVDNKNTSSSGNHGGDGDEEEDMDMLLAKKCAAIVSSLRNLQDLALEACSVVDGTFLNLIPNTLHHLEITHCWNLTADDLCNFLQGCGANLRSLVLNHNDALDLGFLAVLGRSCPKLVDLFVNLNVFYSPKTRDQDPEDEMALPPHRTPSWPGSLQRLELLHARKRFTPEAAQVLLRSLMMSSRRLPDLRYLVLKMVIKELGWRERANLRSDWLTRLEKVFLQPISARPLPYHSLRQAVAPHMHSSAVTPRRSHRISTRHSSDSCPSSAASTSSKRLSYAEPPDDPADDSGADRFVSDDDDYGPRDPFANDPEYFIQGKCQRVELTVGDNNPVAMQFQMDDFLDDDSTNHQSDSDFET